MFEIYLLYIQLYISITFNIFATIHGKEIKGSTITCYQDSASCVRGLQLIQQDTKVTNAH